MEPRVWEDPETLTLNEGLPYLVGSFLMGLSLSSLATNSLGVYLSGISLSWGIRMLSPLPLFTRVRGTRILGSSP